MSAEQPTSEDNVMVRAAERSAPAEVRMVPHVPYYFEGASENDPRLADSAHFGLGFEAALLCGFQPAPGSEATKTYYVFDRGPSQRVADIAGSINSTKGLVALVSGRYVVISESALGHIQAASAEKRGVVYNLGWAGLSVDPKQQRVAYLGRGAEGQKGPLKTLHGLSDDVSGRHVSIEYGVDGIALTDLDSSNGTNILTREQLLETIGIEPEAISNTNSDRVMGLASEAARSLVGEVLDKPLDSGAAVVSRNRVMVAYGYEVAEEDRKKQCQDALIRDNKRGIFGVFDGVGGLKDGHLASRAARDAFGDTMKFYPDLEVMSLDEQKSEVKLRIHSALVAANDAVLEKQDPRSEDKCCTTGTVAQIIRSGGAVGVVYGSVGDSRLYKITADGQLTQCTKDQGEGRDITNALGSLSQPIQMGYTELKKGDTILLCTDGITGDVEPTLLPNAQLERLVSYAKRQGKSDQEIADWVMQNALKIDDRTIIVATV